MRTIKIKKCKNCQYCERLYRKIIKFWKMQRFVCVNCNRLIKLNDSCEQWQRKVIEYDFSSERFDYVEECLRYIENNTYKNNWKAVLNILLYSLNCLLCKLYNFIRIYKSKIKASFSEAFCCSCYFLVWFVVLVVVDLKQLHYCVDTLEVVVTEVIYRYAASRAVAYKLYFGCKEAFHIADKRFELDR